MTITIDQIENYIRDGLKKDIDRIIEEETIEAQRKVASRVMTIKQQAITNILAKFRMTRIDNPSAMQIILNFEV